MEERRAAARWCQEAADRGEEYECHTLRLPPKCYLGQAQALCLQDSLLLV